MDDDTLVTLQVFNLPIDAEMARSELEAYGVEALLLDNNVAILDPFITLVNGGIRLQIRQADVARAREILAPTTQLDLPAEEDETPGPPDEGRGVQPHPAPLTDAQANPTRGTQCLRCGSPEIAPHSNNRTMIWILFALFLATLLLGFMGGRSRSFLFVGFAGLLDMAAYLVFALYVFPSVFHLRRWLCRACGYRWIGR
jgi:hypothetical protein